MGCVGRSPVEVDELVEHWTVLEDEQQLVAGNRGATRLGFALLLKFYTRSGRFPRGRSELPQEAVNFVALQMKVPAGDLGFYEWSGSTIEYHRAQIRQHLGYRECGVTDAERLTAWLAEHVTQAERRPDRVREELLARCRVERVEPPAEGRVDRIVRSALRLGEETLTRRVSARLNPAATETILALIGPGTPETVDGDGDGGEPSLLGTIKEAPGNVSLETMLTEIDKLVAVRAIGLPADLFGDVAPKVVAAWRARGAVESPSHLRTHPMPLRLTLLAALLHEREREITDTLVDLLIATVHRISARAEKKVTTELVNAFKRVGGKENILFQVAGASLAAPDDPVRQVVFPAVAGGEQTLRELVHEFKTKGPVYRRTVATTLKASYTNHYRRGLIKLLDVLEFRSGNTAHQPVIEALTLIRRYAGAGHITYYPLDETVPTHRGLGGDLEDVAYRADTRGQPRVVRMVYEVATFQALRDQLRCKEIWVVGADRWRNPDEDLPADFAERRAENYRELRKPLDPAVFVEELREQMRTELAALNEQLPRLGGWTSPSAARGRSDSPRHRPSPNPATCAGSRPRCSAAGATSRWSTCSRKPCCAPGAWARSPRSPPGAASHPACWQSGCCWRSTPTAPTPGSRPWPPAGTGTARTTSATCGAATSPRRRPGRLRSASRTPPSPPAAPSCGAPGPPRWPRTPPTCGPSTRTSSPSGTPATAGVGC